MHTPIYVTIYTYAIKYYSPIKRKSYLWKMDGPWGHYDKWDREREILHDLLNVESKKFKTKQNTNS